MQNIFLRLGEHYDSGLVSNLEQINSNLDLMRVDELWKLIESKKGPCNKPGSEMDIEGQQDLNSQRKEIKYIGNILEVLSKVKFQLRGI